MRAKKIVLTLLIILAISAVICFVGVYGYTGNVPKLTLKTKAFDMPGGVTCIASEMVDVKCRGDYELRINILDTNIPTAKVTEDSSAVYTGDTSGFIHVEILGIGKRSEGGHPVDAYIFAGADEEEQVGIIDNSNQACLMIDSYLHDEFFTEKNNTEEGRSRFDVIYNTKDAYGEKKEMTEELFAEYVKKFEGAELIGALGYYYQDPYGENKDLTANKYLLLYKTEKSGKLYLTVSGFGGGATADEKIKNMHVMEDAPDGGGSYLYDIEKSNIESAEKRNSISDSRHQSKLGEKFNMYVEDLSQERYESWEDNKDKLIEGHLLYYVFELIKSE